MMYYFSMKAYVICTHYKQLGKSLLMTTHYIYFHEKKENVHEDIHQAWNRLKYETLYLSSLTSLPLNKEAFLYDVHFSDIN